MQAIWDIDRWLLTWDNYIFDSTPQRTKQSYLREHYLPLYRGRVSKKYPKQCFSSFLPDQYVVAGGFLRITVSIAVINNVT